MGQEFTINSAAIEAKINSLLPSQGGAGAGIDFSASTMIIPIVDVTESASGSVLREDLQTSLSLTSITSFAIRNAVTTIVNTTGYWRVFGSISLLNSTTTDFLQNGFQITDGTTTKQFINYITYAAATPNVIIVPYDFNVLLQAGESLQVNADDQGTGVVRFSGATRQIASIDGTLTNP